MKTADTAKYYYFFYFFGENKMQKHITYRTVGDVCV